jgi:hypothetical protein
MFNLLINEGKDIRYTVVEDKDAIFCGTPQEFFDFKECKHYKTY